MRTASFVLGIGLLAALSLGCDRNIEPYTDDPVAQPDLARIFPEAADGNANQPPIMPPPPGSRGTGAAPAAAPASSGAGAGAALQGTLSLAPALAGKVPSGAILFVIARTGPAGPPTAVLRIPDPVFPMSFRIGPEDRMIQQMPFAGPFTVTARVDADGNAMTRNPGDLQGASAEPHSPGDTGIAIVIDEVL